MGTIVAISGGELTDFRSKLINDTIIRLSQKRNPKVLLSLPLRMIPSLIMRNLRSISVMNSNVTLLPFI